MTCKSASFYIKEENIDYISEQIAGKKRYNKSNWLDDLIDHLRAKADPKKKAPKPPKVLPAGLNVEAWSMWTEYRKQIKKPLKTDSQAKNLIKLGVTMEGQLAVVMQSINNEYQGLFEVKNEGIRQSGHATNVKPSEIDKLNQAMLDKYGHAATRNERAINPDGDTRLDTNEVQGRFHAEVDGNGITIDMEAGDQEFNG